MDKDPKIFLRHILESIEAIEKYMHDLGKTEFYQSGQIQDGYEPQNPYHRLS